MAQITQNDITFNSVINDNRAGVVFGQYPLHLAGMTGPDEDGGIINAVDIDWNDAQWPKTTPSEPTTIKTTGDLISAIKYASTVGYEADKSNNKNNE
ncbi:MAG: hypothetical protein SPL55_08125 [Prevotella sp.]|nr:hypothetical protein [Prevotella sp.]